MNLPAALSTNRNFFLKAALLFCWVPFIVLGYYAQPFLDDYWNGSVARDLGFVQAWAYQFNNWSGRFFTNALLVGLNPLGYSWLGGIKLVGPVSTLLKLGMLLWAGRVLSAGRLSRANVAWLAGGLLLFYYTVLPDKYGSIYSFTYWAVYQVPCLLMLAVPLAVIEYHRRANAPGRWVYLAVAAIGSVCTAASNEMSFLLLGWVLAVCAAVSLYRRQWTNAYVWIFLGLLLAASGFVSIVLAPGNHSRMQAEFSANTSYAPAVLLPRVAKALKYLLTDTGTLVIFAIPLLLRTLGKKLIAVRPAGLHLPFSLGVLVIIAGLILGALPYNIVGYPALERPVNVLYWWLLISWLVVCWASLPATDEQRGLPRAVVLFTSLAVACIVVPTVGRAWLELLVDAPAYQRQYDARYQTLRHVAAQAPQQQKIATLAPIEGVTPRYILIRDEVGTQSSYDVQTKASATNNIRIANWFGLDSVRMVSTLPY